MNYIHNITENILKINIQTEEGKKTSALDNDKPETDRLIGTPQIARLCRATAGPLAA